MEPDDFDIDAGVADIAAGLGLELGDDPPIVDATEVVDAAAAPVIEAVRNPPQSWAKETHDIWKTLSPQAQEQIERREKQMLEGLGQYKEHNEFGRQMREVFTPYRDMIQQQGLDEAKAAQFLLNAHHRLGTLPQEQRLQYLAQIASNYGIEIPGLQEQAADPRYSRLESQVQQLSNVLTQQQQTQYREARKVVEGEVNAFAADPANIYFNDVGDDVVVFIGAGMNLQDAYKKAVWANPVTREKELARIKTEAEANLRQKSKQETDAARKASSTNVRSRDTRGAPTEPLGKMEDTMRSTLEDIKSRAH